MHHSDHGSQYVSLLPSKTMRENGVRPSMGSISSPWDNAAMESLMGIVRTFLPAVVTPPSERKSAAGGVGRMGGADLVAADVILERSRGILALACRAEIHHAAFLAVFVPGNVSAEGGDCDRAPQRQEAEAFQGASRGCQVALPAASTGTAEERGDRQVGVAAVMEDELLQNRH